MLNYNIFFIVVLLTILLTRLWLFLKPISSPKIKEFRLHHYMYGLVIIVLSLFIYNIILYGIGFGLVVDEMPLFLTHKNNNFHLREYNSLFSKIGVIICLVLVYIFRQYLILK